MNYSTAILLADERVKFIGVRFANYAGTVYTYKTIDQTIKEGDLVVVPSSDYAKKGRADETTSRFGSIAVVDSDDVAVNMQSSDIEYKWIIQKIDVTNYEKIIEVEKEIVEKIRGMELKTNRAKLAAMFGIDTDTVKSLPKLPD
jgi:Pyruvate/2-oxoacid:ferredoxin oxidoreductase gamma subunit